MQRNNEKITHLENLAGALARRNFIVQVITRGASPCVKVANPDIPELNERVLCDQAADASWCFWWPWRQPIGSVDDLETVVRRITTVLRSVEGLR